MSLPLSRANCEPGIVNHISSSTMEAAVRRGLAQIDSLCESRKQLFDELQFARREEERLKGQIAILEVEKVELQNTLGSQLERLQRDYDVLRKEAEARRTALLACMPSSTPSALPCTVSLPVVKPTKSFSNKPEGISRASFAFRKRATTTSQIFHGQKCTSSTGILLRSWDASSHDTGNTDGSILAEVSPLEPIYKDVVLQPSTSPKKETEIKALTSAGQLEVLHPRCTRGLSFHGFNWKSPRARASSSGGASRSISYLEPRDEESVLISPKSPDLLSKTSALVLTREELLAVVGEWKSVLEVLSGSLHDELSHQKQLLVQKTTLTEKVVRLEKVLHGSKPKQGELSINEMFIEDSTSPIPNRRGRRHSSSSTKSPTMNTDEPKESTFLADGHKWLSGEISCPISKSGRASGSQSAYHPQLGLIGNTVA